MDDREFDEAVKAHNAPPPTPRERMWAKIDAERSERRGVLQPQFAPRPRPVPWRRGGFAAAGVAAVLVLGMAIGRWTAPTLPPVSGVADGGTATGLESVAPAAGPVAGADATGRPVRPIEQEVYRLAASQLFGRADFLLTDVKVRACAGEGPQDVARLASGMLTQTRLLLDSPAAADPDMRSLLEDLELVLAQIAGLTPADCTRDLAWIKAGLERRDTLGRLRLLTDDTMPARAL